MLTSIGGEVWKSVAQQSVCLFIIESTCISLSFFFTAPYHHFARRSVSIFGGSYSSCDLDYSMGILYNTQVTLNRSAVLHSQTGITKYFFTLFLSHYTPFSF